MVEDFVDVVEWVFFVDNRIEQNAKGPDILFFAPVGLALQDFGGGVVSRNVSISANEATSRDKVLPIVPTKTSNGPFLM